MASGKKKAIKKKIGAPTVMTQEAKDKVCRMVSETSYGMRAISNKVGVSYTAVKEALRKDADFAAQYARAKQDQADVLADEIIEISDDSTKDIDIITMGEIQVPMVNKEVIMRSKLRVDSRKWLAAKLAPKKYGEAIQVDVTETKKVVVTRKKKDDVPAN